MYLLDVNGIEKYAVLCEHPEPEIWKNFILCFNVKNIDVSVRSDYQYESGMIINEGSLTFGDNKIIADKIVPIFASKRKMTYPTYSFVRSNKEGFERITEMEGMKYSYSLLCFQIGMGETCLRFENKSYNIDAYFLGVDYIDMPLDSDRKGVFVQTTETDILYISSRVGRYTPQENVHVLMFENSKHYIVGKFMGFYKNNLFNYELCDLRKRGNQGDGSFDS